MTRYLRSARMACLEKTNGGVIYLLPDLLIKAATLVPQVFLWRTVILSGAQVDMTLPQTPMSTPADRNAASMINTSAKYAQLTAAA